MDINYNSSQGRIKPKNAYRVFQPPPPIGHWIQCFWQLDVPHGKYHYRSVPDNSVDWILNPDCPDDNFIITPFSSAIVFELSGPATYFGIRFRLFGQQGLIAEPLGEWTIVNNEIKAADVLPNHLIACVYEIIRDNSPFGIRSRKLSRLLPGRFTYPDIDSRLVRFIRYCCSDPGSNIDLSGKQCADFGLSSRQLRRLARLYLGLSPREFARVIRFQHSIQAMNSGDNYGAWTQYYYDQPHFNREFRRLAGLTPTEFRSLSVLYKRTPGI